MLGMNTPGTGSILHARKTKYGIRPMTPWQVAGTTTNSKLRGNRQI
jgi:hypothetical protein